MHIYTVCLTCALRIEAFFGSIDSFHVYLCHQKISELDISEGNSSQSNPLMTPRPLATPNNDQPPLHYAVWQGN